MDSMIHIFIIWENALAWYEGLLYDIEKKFTVKAVYDVSWSPQYFTNNLKRFYGDTLPKPFKKTENCGTGNFLVIICEDIHPKIGLRKTSIGKQYVNTNVYDCKISFRRRIGGDYPIHASINKKETDHDLTLIFGKNVQDFIKIWPEHWNGKIISFAKDLVGHNGWRDLNQLFYVLNSTTNYLVLRNFEDFPEIKNECHKDIDILTDDRWQILHILNMQLIDDEKGIKRSYVLIENKKISLDIKYVRDGYYDEKWSKKMLEKKILSKKGFYLPDEEDYFYSLLYHALIHKKTISNEYLSRLIRMGKKLSIEGISDKTTSFELEKILKKFLKKKNYKNTNSFSYKSTHNELNRMMNVAIHAWKEEGFTYLLRAIKSKIKKMIIDKK